MPYQHVRRPLYPLGTVNTPWAVREQNYVGSECHEPWAVRHIEHEVHLIWDTFNIRIIQSSVHVHCPPLSSSFSPKCYHTHNLGPQYALTVDSTASFFTDVMGAASGLDAGQFVKISGMRITGNNVWLRLAIAHGEVMGGNFRRNV